MRIRSRRSINGVLTGYIFILITLLVLGIVTGRIIFYILMGAMILFAILAAIGLFTFLKQTGQESTKRSTYDITESKGMGDLTKKWEKDVNTSSKEERDQFCNNCGMKLEPEAKICSNCGT